MSIYSKHRNAHSVGWSTWHFQWCTKYRHKVFSTLYLKKLCEVLIKDIAKLNNVEIIDVEVDADHVHVIASISLSVAPTDILHQLKGGTSKALFILVPDLKDFYWSKKRFRHLWSSGKFIASVGHITVDKAKQYLEAHHAKSYFMLGISAFL